MIIPNYFFADTDVTRVLEMQRAFQGIPFLHAVNSDSNKLGANVHLDAMYLSVVAAERWGARPIVHEAQVLNTRHEDRENNWPAYILAGVAMRPGDSRDAKDELRMIIDAVTRAVLNFNATHDCPIKSVGFVPEWTGIRRIDAREAGEIIGTTFSRLVPGTRPSSS